MLWLTSKWREDNESAQDDDIESKDFEGESGKGGFAESNAEIQTFFFLNSEARSCTLILKILLISSANQSDSTAGVQ